MKLYAAYRFAWNFVKNKLLENFHIIRFQTDFTHIKDIERERGRENEKKCFILRIKYRYMWWAQYSKFDPKKMKTEREIWCDIKYKNDNDDASFCGKIRWHCRHHHHELLNERQCVYWYFLYKLCIFYAALLYILRIHTHKHTQNALNLITSIASVSLAHIYDGFSLLLAIAMTGLVKIRNRHTTCSCSNRGMAAARFHFMRTVNGNSNSKYFPIFPSIKNIHASRIYLSIGAGLRLERIWSSDGTQYGNIIIGLKLLFNRIVL